MKNQGRVHLLTIPRMALALCTFALVATSLFLSSTFPARAASVSPASCTTITSNRTGTDGNYYSFWTAGSGSVSMTECTGSYYNVYWSGVGDFVAGKGWATGSSHSVSYSGSFNPSGTAYL